MCHFVTATLPRSADAGAVASQFAAAGRGFVVIANRHLESQIDRGDQYYLTTAGRCDCGTVLGSLADSGRDPGRDVEQEVAKLRRRGWSEAKVGRWRLQVEGDRVRRRREERGQAGRGVPSAGQWVTLVREVLGSGATPRIGLLLHWYAGGVESERIQLKSQRQVPRSELTPELLMRMDEDVLYEFSSTLSANRGSVRSSS